MDKNAIKKYAVWARRELISRVSQKALQYGITASDIALVDGKSVNGSVLSDAELKQRRALLEQIHLRGYEQVMEEVAYTWFNRFIALRFMEVNGYLPSHVRVFTDEGNRFEPQILSEAINLELDGLDMDRVYALKEANDDAALFKYLIIVQCNALSPILPGMFQRISDYTELLFPDNLLREGSVIQQMIALIPEQDWQDAVQIIGWLYQYYNSEKKDEVFAALKRNVKITRENIPAATQLFTPDWIVRYMVENSLGRLWLEGHPGDELKSGWKYYLDEAQQEPEVQAQLNALRREYATITPEQIKCIDPCVGSGHILAYLFDVLVQIYEAYGYTAREAVRSIVEHNLYGLDIDGRAAQLAYFAVMMKARQYDRRFLSRRDDAGNPDVPQPNVYAIVDSNGVDPHALDYFINGDARLKAAMYSIIGQLRDAKEYGSILDITPVDFAALHARFDEVRADIDMSREVALQELLPLVQVAQVLARRYDVVVTNPPYMGSANMSAKLSDYVKANYPDSKSDLFAVFMERCGQLTAQGRYQAMITQHSWMFLSSFEKLRSKLLATDTVNMVHLGARAFEEIGGEVVQTTSFVMRQSYMPSYKGTYCRLIEPVTQQGKEDMFLSGANRYTAKQSNFAKIPGSPVAYWVSERFMQAFEKGVSISELASPKKGLATTDNNRFLRLWHEVSIIKMGVGYDSAEKAKASKKRWFPLNKGGEFRRWYGNKEYLVNWENNGKEMKDAVVKRYNGGSYTKEIRSEDRYFQDSITWSALTAGMSSFRYSNYGALFDSAGSSMFPKTKWRYILALLNTKISQEILTVINPTLNYGAGSVGNIPVIINERYYDAVNRISEENVTISHTDWDSFETSWDFQKHPLIGRGVPTVAQAYAQWEQECAGRFNTLKANEEELNRIFIDIYGLNDELTPEVEDRDVTVRRADLGRDVRSLISYAVGCMFGRYSLDAPGLAYAGGDWDGQRYVTFPVSVDGIIPICDDDYFPDDILGRFVRFIEVAYGSDTLGENLRFIADALGGRGQPREVIRNYFISDFYSDHLKLYQKRPIYWLFDSGKKNGFKALIYMHRYQPDTIARMRTDYVHEQQARYRTAIADIEQRMAQAATGERVKLSRRLKTLSEQSAELQSYEEKIHHLADQYISIDLDDGVKKNYAIFADVLSKIK